MKEKKHEVTTDYKPLVGVRRDFNGGEYARIHFGLSILVQILELLLHISDIFLFMYLDGDIGCYLFFLKFEIFSL